MSKKIVQTSKKQFISRLVQIRTISGASAATSTGQGAERCGQDRPLISTMFNKIMTNNIDVMRVRGGGPKIVHQEITKQFGSKLRLGCSLLNYGFIEFRMGDGDIKSVKIDIPEVRSQDFSQGGRGTRNFPPWPLNAVILY